MKKEKHFYKSILGHGIVETKHKLSESELKDGSLIEISEEEYVSLISENE